MPPTNILIVEDDMIIGAHISMVLANAGHEIAGILPSGKAAIEHIRNEAPDLVMMDISLKGDMDGVETAQVIADEFQTPLIFLTANSDQPTYERAKATKPYGFISKPFKEVDLARSVELVLSRIQEDKDESPTIENEEDDSVVLEDRIFIRSKDKMVKIFLKDVLYIEAERNYSRVYTREKEFLMSMPLKTLESRLKSNDLMRIHRSYVVNITQLDELDEHYVYINSKAIPISKSYKDSLTRRLKLL